MARMARRARMALLVSASERPPLTFRLPTVAEQAAQLANVLEACARSADRAPAPDLPAPGAYQEAARLISQAAHILEDTQEA